MRRPSSFLLATVALACISLAAPPPRAFAQVPAAPAEAAAGKVYSAAELEKLVGPFALYPDDLVAIIVPASTFPLQIVQADRFLEKRKANPKLEVDAGWDDSVKSLLNYPEVVKKMSSDLDWTEDLGEAVVSNTGSVMEAVQAFRRRAQGAGNLKSDKQQTVIVEQEVIKIEPTDPQVVYVPQYEPSQVVVYGSPYYYPYSPPYPAYWYPYAPGAALAAGVIWGAAIGAIWSGGRYVSHYGGNNNITINRGNNNVNTGNIGSGNRGGGNRNTAGNTSWKSNKQPGQVAGGGGNRQGSRAGDARGGTGTMGAGAGAGGGAGGRAGGGASASTRPSGGGDAFGGINSGSSANRASSRGTESRAGGSSAGRSSPSTGARSSGGFSGGGARAGGGGGGARGGGGGGRGGGGRR